MSTLVSTYLQDRGTTKKLGTERVIEGAVKMWVEFDGITNVVNRSFNLSSVVDTGVGNWSVQATAVFDGPHAASGSAHNAGVAWALWSGVSNGNTAIAVMTYQVMTATPYDCSVVACSSCGRLA